MNDSLNIGDLVIIGEAKPQEGYPTNVIRFENMNRYVGTVAKIEKIIHEGNGILLEGLDYTYPSNCLKRVRYASVPDIYRHVNNIKPGSKVLVKNQKELHTLDSNAKANLKIEGKILTVNYISDSGLTAFEGTLETTSVLNLINLDEEEVLLKSGKKVSYQKDQSYIKINEDATLTLEDILELKELLTSE